MTKVLLLICAATLSPAECTPDTARAVIDGGEQVICVAMPSQALLASTGLRAGQGEYVLVKCERAA